MVHKAAIFLVAVLPALGDFSYQETSRITGGMMSGVVNSAAGIPAQAREPVVNTVAVKGNRMLRTGAHRGSIIDLDKQTITQINFDKKQYSVMTFEQMNERMAAVSPRNAAGALPSVEASTKETGRTKQIGGVTAREQVITVEMGGSGQASGVRMGMTMTSDVWVGPQVEGYDEMLDFRKRMSEKLKWTPDGMGARPGMMGAVAELTKASMGLNGTPRMQTMTIGNPMRPQASGQAAMAQGTLIEMTTEYGGFSSTAVDDAKFEVPAGFQQVEPEFGWRPGGTAH